MAAEGSIAEGWQSIGSESVRKKWLKGRDKRDSSAMFDDDLLLGEI